MVVFDNLDGTQVRFIGQGLPTSPVHHADEIDISATISRVERFDPGTNQVVSFVDYSASPENARFLIKAAFDPELISTSTPVPERIMSIPLPTRQTLPCSSLPAVRMT